jgi:immune inhibitor A
MRLLLTALLVATACVQEARPSPSPSVEPTREPAAAPVDMTEALARTTLPNNDLFALTRRLSGRDGTPGPFEPVRATVPSYAVGERHSFYFYNFRTKRNERVSASVRHRTEHAYWYVQDNVQVDPAKLAQTALEFEGKIYPTNRRIYGEEWSPGIDNDPRITILFARIPDVAGYFSSADEYPRWINEFSAEREIVYINIDAVEPGGPYLLSVLAHEFAHMIQFNKRKRSVVWFNEGQAQLAEHANGYPPGFSVQFLATPDTQLNDWADEPGQSAAHYGHAFLFLQYLAERFGGTEVIKELLTRGVDTPLDIDAVLRARGSSMVDAYLDFVATNGLTEAAPPPAPYRYAQLKLPAAAKLRTSGALDVAATRSGTVHQYASRYFELPGGKLSVDFRGATHVRILPTDPHSGSYLWWSNRADGVNTSLTRAIDLRGVSKATLQFWTWFDIERDFDYAYVSVSADAGRTWKSLRGSQTTSDDPNGNNLGNGITHVSGGGAAPAWVEERMDLSPFAGQEVLVRFDYVTDGALNKNGFAIDDLAVPEIGWRDDAEQEGDWEAAGFVRSSNFVRETFAVQVLRLGDRPGVERLPVPADGRLRFELELGDARSALLAVSAFAAQTVEPGTFELRVEQRP